MRRTLVLFVLLTVLLALQSCGKPMSRLSTGDNVYVPTLRVVAPSV